MNSYNDLEPEQKEVLQQKVVSFVKSRKKVSTWRENQDLNKEEFRTGSDEALLDDKQQVGHLKQVSKDIERGIHKSLGKASRELAKLVSTDPAIDLSDFGEQLANSAADIEGQKRFEVIHEDSFWDPSTPHVSPMLFEGSGDKHVLAVSSFQAAGPGRSSQAPRNNPKNPVMANFFKTGMTVKAKAGPDRANEVFSATRSAITVEFDVVDGQQRAEANKKLVKQQLDSQVGAMFAKMSDEEIDAAAKGEKPLILKSQTTNLLTPDLGRNLAREHQSVANMASKLFNQHAGAPADDERALALENLAAHQHWDKQEAQEYTVTKADGTQVTVKVKYDIAYFNIPNNKMAEAYQKKRLSTFLRPKEIEEANQKSWGKLEKDVEERKSELDELLALACNAITNAELYTVNDLIKASAEKQKLRREIMAKTVKKGSIASTKEQFNTWQAKADAMGREIKTLYGEKGLSDAMCKVLDLIDEREQLLDLHMDTKELFESGMSRDVQYMDNNRSGLATRVILLGQMAKRQGHFGCRSGKDRTGLVDMDAKVTLVAAEFEGRILSFREQEKHPNMLEWRRVVMLESGNKENTKANMGAGFGLNIGGAANLPAGQGEAAERHQQIVSATIGMAGMASRPKTKREVPLGYAQKWEESTMKSRSALDEEAQAA